MEERRYEDGLDEEKVSASVEEGTRLELVSLHELHEICETRLADDDDEDEA